MQTPEPLTIERLYELCELAKVSPKGSLVKVKREELWALVDMAKQVEETERLRTTIKEFAAAVQTHAFSMSPPNPYTPAFVQMANSALLSIRPLPNNETGNARPFGE